MRFLRLTAVGESHDGEEGTSGQRRATLHFLACDLRAAELRRDMLRNQLEKPPKPGAPIAPDSAPLRVSLGTHRPSSWTRARPSAAAVTARANTPVVSAAPRMASLMAKLTAAEERVRFERTRLEGMGCKLRPDGSIDWNATDRVVQYDHDLRQQGMTEVKIQSGLLTLRGHPLDTRKMVTAFAGPGYAIYVLSAEGKLHVSGHSVGHRHHSSLLAGKAVAGAGELKCTNGRLEILTNKSGHYKPSLVHLVQVIHLLLKNGVASTFAVKVLPERTTYPNVDALLNTIAPENTYEVAKLRRYWPYLKDEILEQHQPDPWRTCDFDREQMGVYSASSGAMIPHTLVRQWFKSRGMMAQQLTQSGAGR